MDLEQLNKIDTSNAAQVKELQTFLKTRGYYSGPIDGKWGGGTTEGAVKLRTDLTETAKVGRDTAVANQEANDPTNNAIRGATEFGPYAAGAGLGMWGGHAAGKGLTALGAKHAAETAKMANDPKISGAVGERKMGSMRTARNAATGAQFLAPAALLGSAQYMRDYVNPRFEGETKKWMDLGVNAEQGAGLGIGAHQLLDLRNRFASPADAADEARIETRAAAERVPKPPAPPPDAPPQPPALRTPSDRLASAARAAGAQGKLTKAAAADYLGANVTPANRAAVAAELGVGPGEKIAGAVKKLATSRKPSVLIGPSIAAGVAYDAASGDAEAAGATPQEAQTRGALAGTGAAALTGGAMYGASKLANFAPVKSLLGMASKASGPLMLNDMAMQAHRGIYGSGPQFLDVPEKSPVRSQLSNYTAEANGPLSNASALAVPDNIPPNAARDAEAAAMAAEGPSPARAAYGDQKFDAALSGFLAMIEEHNSSVGGGQSPNFRQAPAMIGAR